MLSNKSIKLILEVAKQHQIPKSSIQLSFSATMKPRVLWRTPAGGAAKARLGLEAETRGSEQWENLTLPANLQWKAGRHDWRCQKVVTFLVFLDSLSIHEKCQPVSQTWCLQNFSATLKWTA